MTLNLEMSSTTGMTHVPVVTFDPTVRNDDASTAEWTNYKIQLQECSSELLEIYENDESITGEVLWSDFTTSFSEQGIRNLRKAAQTQWSSLLVRLGVHVKTGRNIRRADALIECLRSENVPSISTDLDKPDSIYPENVKNPEIPKGESSCQKIPEENTAPVLPLS